VLTRRDLLLLHIRADRSAELSCERLLMKYVDSLIDGSTDDLFARLDEELRSVHLLRLVDTEWLSRDDFREALDRVLDVCRQRGLIVSR
jgi:hypothetical protein